MERQNRKEPKGRIGAGALFLLLALILPLSVNMLRANIDVIGAAGERVAAFAAMANMPDAGLDILIERFLDELGPREGRREDESQAHIPESAPVLTAPAQPQEDEYTPSPQQDAGSPRQFLARPRIPTQYQAPLLRENLAGSPGGQIFLHGAGLIRNEIRLTNDQVRYILQTPHSLTFEDTDQPQVLIYHTHATEAFERHDSDIYDIRNTWRSNDNNINIVAVGAVMAQVLEENGISVIHNSTQHDFPSYNRAYERSAQTISYYLEKYPSIRVVLDIHRDALERDNRVIVKPVVEIGGQTAAQVMILVGSDNSNLNMPNWRENLRFAAAFQDAIENAHPQLARPAWLKYRRYNQHLSTGGLLLEIGSNANTLEEASYSAMLAGEALADLILDNMLR